MPFSSPANRSRRIAALAIVAFLGATLLTAAQPPRPASAANAFNLLIADNLGKRILITDPWGAIKWEFRNPLNNGDRYSGPLGVKWLPGNKILATFGTGTVGLIDAATKTFDWKFYGCSSSNWLLSPYDAELLPDGNLAIATRYNEGGRIAVYSRQGCQIVWKYLLSNAHSVRLYQPGYGTSQATLLMGGWGKTAEAVYQAGSAPRVVWQAPTEYTHDAIVTGDGSLITVEGYYIQRITRANQRLWKVMTPDEERRVAINPDGGYVFTVADADRVEFRREDGSLIRTFSYLNDNTKLDLPYGIQVVCWPDRCGSGSPSPTPTPTSAPSPTPTPAPTATPSPTTQPSGTLVSDGFESGGFTGWTVRTDADGSATVQRSVVRTGTYAARFSATSASGSYAYARRTLSSTQTRLTVAANLRIDVEGGSGANVPLIRLYNGSGVRLLALYRQNQSGDAVWLQYGGGYQKTAATLPLGSWARFDLSVVVNGSSSTVIVKKNGSVVFSTTSANLGTSPIAAFQLGNDTASQPFTSYADDLLVTTP